MKKIFFGKLTLPILINMFMLSACSGKSTSNKTPPFTKPQTTLPVLESHFENSLIIPLTINNITRNFIVDTGASLTAIDKNLAAQVTRPLRPEEIPPTYKEFSKGITTVYGTLNNNRFNLVKPVPFFIGNEKVSDNDVWVTIDTTLFSQAMGIDIAGFIGIDIIRKFNWQIDNVNKTFVITRDAPSALNWQHCTGYDDSYNLSPQFIFTHGNDNITFRIDTGTDRGYVASEFIDYIKSKRGALNLDVEDSLNGDLLGSTNSALYILKGLSFNKMPLGEIKLTENPNQLYAMGMDFLSRFTRYAFIPSRMMFCYDANNIERHNLKSQRNISVRYFNQHIELFYNSRSSLEGTGLRNGDILQKLNGVKYPPEQIDKIRDILELTPKGKLTLTIQRGATTNTVIL